METYGDLKKAINTISLKQKGAKIGNVALDAVLGAIPGIGAAKSTFDFVKAAFLKPDTKKSNSWLDKLDIDDEMSSIVDDTVENGFLKMVSKTIDSETDTKPLEQDFNMNAKMVTYLKNNYSGRTVSGIKEQKSVFDKFFTKFAYKFDKGYPDMNNDQDVLLLESLISETVGYKFNLNELVKLEYDILTDESKKLAQELISLLGITQDQIKPSSKNKIVIYDDNRDVLTDRIEDSGKYGKRRHPRSGNFKIGNTFIILKPGAKGGEYYELKPQQLGITLDKKISLSTLFKEIERGIRDNTIMSDEQKKVLLYTVNKENKPTQEEITSAMEAPSFYNETLKNLGEPLGALVYGQATGFDSVEFPGAGNYPLIDYLLFNGDEQVQISAKTSKGMGNTVKLNDLKKVIEKKDGEIDDKKLKVIDTISSKSVLEGPLDLIDEIGSTELKKELEVFKQKYPEFPKINNPYNREAHAERIQLEKKLIKELNANPDYNFNDLFNEYVAVRYVKYKLNPKTLESGYDTIDSGQFNVSLASKNSPGHDSDRVGLAVKKLK